MSTDVFEHFGCLDELVQVIYQGISRFVVLSKVDHDSWTVHLALSGPEGRWWRGTWGTSDILNLAGSKPSAKLLETFAERLAETFIQGELFVDSWSPDASAPINLTFGPTSKKPLHIPLTELSPQEAASHATKLLFEIALQAQPRKCRLNATYGSSLALPTPHTNTTTSVTAAVPKSIPSTSITRDAQAQEEIKALKVALENEKKRHKSPVELAAKSSSVPRPPKGASLANPNKKARKYQALEFESDDE